MCNVNASLRHSRLLLPFLLGSCLPWTTVSAEIPNFRRHDLNPQSTYSACAAIDVNRDGKLDVVCGGWWYEAPNWRRHFLREVEIIRGRYDDYSNLPLDINDDGWKDLVSANYRSQTLYWIEHPGAQLGQWTAHIVAKPGPMETARLVDIDGDGQLDVLPNGTQFAAWWEYRLQKSETDGQTVRWLRHELPQELAGHGIGSGDINGDGRVDVVGPNGWAEAPQDRRRDRWRWHPDFRLHPDCGIPILVQDVDLDGDSDLIWGRGHRTGLYWMEQITSQAEPAAVRWQLHVIDTSWSQAHSLLTGDLDGDGTPELIAGKRYLGHEGRDLGEYDPMTICAYQFDSQTSTWNRKIISEGESVGFGLDPKLVDLDEDGDLDLICPGRSGLFILENLLVSDQPSSEDDASQNPDSTSPALTYAAHSTLLVYNNRQGQQQPIDHPADWGRRRAHILASMQQVMGRLPNPSRRVPLDVQILQTAQTDKYVRKTLTFATEPGDRVPAYLLVPKGLRGPGPAMLCLHQTTRIGKGEPAGLGGQPSLHYAHELAERGYICLVPDYPSFGDYEYDFQQSREEYLSGSMKAIWNNLRAVDLLESLPEVDRDRIGCIGHSLGGHNTLFTAVMDQRIQVAVTSCGFTAFHDYYGGNLAGWTSDRYMPRIREVYHNNPNEMPFDFHEVLAAIAPRPIFINAPLHDSNFDVGGVRKVVASCRGVYSLLKAEDRLVAVYPDCQHDFPDAVRQQCYQWLDRILKRADK